MTQAKQETLWVLRAQAGDREALGLLLQAVQSPLFRYIASLTLDHHVAEDILQEVCIIVCRKVKWLKEPGLFRPWAYRIASRETFRRLRRERQWSDRIAEETYPEPAAPAVSEEFEPELMEQLPQWVDRISPASRAVIVLHYLQEMTLDEIAEVLEIPAGTVKSRLAYGLHCLRERAAEWRTQCSNEG